MHLEHMKLWSMSGLVPRHTYILIDFRGVLGQRHSPARGLTLLDLGTVSVRKRKTRPHGNFAGDHPRLHRHHCGCQAADEKESSSSGVPGISRHERARSAHQRGAAPPMGRVLFDLNFFLSINCTR